MKKSTLMFLKTFLHFLRDADTHSLFINEQNPEFMRVINSIRNPENPEEIEGAFKFLFERTINLTDKNTIFHQESIKLLKKVEEFFYKLNRGQPLTGIGQQMEPEENATEMTNSHLENEQINPSNQQILSSQGRNLPAYDRLHFRKDFLLTPEEAKSYQKKDFNEELAEIYVNSLKSFAVDIEDETLHKHIYYLETDGPWDN